LPTVKVPLKNAVVPEMMIEHTPLMTADELGLDTEHVVIVVPEPVSDPKIPTSSPVKPWPSAAVL
jgi:hypothetical protein